jgi:hypothetical protein
MLSMSSMSRATFLHDFSNKCYFSRYSASFKVSFIKIKAIKFFYHMLIILWRFPISLISYGKNKRTFDIRVAMQSFWVNWDFAKVAMKKVTWCNGANGAIVTKLVQNWCKNCTILHQSPSLPLPAVVTLNESTT